MLRLAVKRDSRARDARVKHSPLEVKASDQIAYLICDSRSKGFPIRHVSKGFEALFGGTADDYLGAALSSQIGPKIESASAAAALNKVAVAAGVNIETGIDRMSRAVEQAMQCAAGGASLPVLLVKAKPSGDLFVCEVSMSKNEHPTLGWPYLAGLIRDVSCEISLEEFLTSTQTDESYASLCSEWGKRGPTTKGGPQDLSSLTEELHGVAEAMWKDELQKGIKPKGQKSVDADTSSIWSRSTASTLASQSERGEKAFHFGALLAGNTSANAAEGDDVARKRFAPATRGRSVRAKLEDSEGFQTAEEDDKDWEECETESHNQSLNSKGSSSLLITDVVNPAKHVDRAVLRNMKIPFVIAAPTVPGFPICLRSKGFEDLFGPSMHVKVGCDAREVLKPANPNDVKAWQHFFDAIMEGRFYLNENANDTLDGWHLPDGGKLAAGELAFIQSFCGRFGNPMECLVYLKHVELDDCPFLLALHAYMPSDEQDGGSHEKVFQRLNARLDEIISEMAAEYVYYAPMRRQIKYHPEQ